jgi:hypothetical protein
MKHNKAFKICCRKISYENSLARTSRDSKRKTRIPIMMIYGLAELKKRNTKDGKNCKTVKGSSRNTSLDRKCI